VATQIVQDLSCVYLVSFDADLVPHDRPLPVRVTVARPSITARARGQMVVQSESERLSSRLLAAFMSPDRAPAGDHLTAGVIPIAFEKGKYRALVQVTTPPSSVSDAVWDVGMSLVCRESVIDDAAGRGRATLPGTRVVFETEVAFPPGPYELVMVAHENTGDEIVTGTVEGAWPDPDDTRATIAKVSIVQPSDDAVFVREKEGTRAMAVDTATQQVRPDQDTAVVSLVCRGGKRRGEAWHAKRRLKADTVAEFPDQPLEFGEDRCVFLSDMVPRAMMTEGAFDYEIQVWDGATELATRSEAFLVSAQPGAGGKPQGTSHRPP
jgi:hypothetical protein